MLSTLINWLGCVLRQKNLFTLRKKRHSSSSWAGKSPNFRREIRQSHYRNDPVKYDLNSTPPILPVWQTRNQTTNCWAKTWNHPTKWCILFVMPSSTFNCCSFSHYTSIVKDCPWPKLCAIYREMGKLFLPTCAPHGHSLPFPPNFMSARCFGRPNLLANGFSQKIWKGTSTVYPVWLDHICVTKGLSLFDSLFFIGITFICQTQVYLLATAEEVIPVTKRLSTIWKAWN